MQMFQVDDNAEYMTSSTALAFTVTAQDNNFNIRMSHGLSAIAKFLI